MKFIKKPITIEAIRWDGTTEGKQAVREFVHADKPLGLDGNVIAVLTNHGLADCNPGDWIICSPAGEYYPCSDAVMQATYDAVPEPQEAELVPIADAMRDPEIHAQIMAALDEADHLGEDEYERPPEEETTGEHKPAEPEELFHVDRVPPLIDGE